MEANEEIDLSERMSIPMKLLPAFNATDHLCEPFAAISISNRDPEIEHMDETMDRVSNWVEESRPRLPQQALVFDVNAEVEPIPHDQDHHDFLHEPSAGLISEEEADEALATFVVRLHTCPRLYITDMRPNTAAGSRLENSYNAYIVDAMAGPAHRRLKKKKAAKMPGTQSTAGRPIISKKAARTKRQVDFTGNGLAVDHGAQLGAGEFANVDPNNIKISRNALISGRNWNEANDKKSLDHVKLRRRENKRSRKAQYAPMEQEPMALDEPRDYEYDNEMEVSYWPNTVPVSAIEGAAAGGPHDQPRPDLCDLGELLEPPAKVAKIFRPYAMRAKQVDMKELKNCTWMILTEQASPERDEVTPTSFGSIYQRLPSKLPSNMRKSLSVPLAFLSVLHVASEKGLNLNQKESLTNFDIVGLNK